MSLTRRAVPVVDVVVSCIVVYAFAIAQPLLDLLGRNAEFFVARRSPASDVVATALIVAVLIPAVLALVVAGVSRLHAPTGAVLHWIVLTVLGGVLAVQIFNHTPIADLTGWIQVVLALAFGVLLTLAFYRLSALRWVFRFGVDHPAADRRSVPVRQPGLEAAVRVAGRGARRGRGRRSRPRS